MNMSKPLPIGTIRQRDQRGYKTIKDPTHPLAATRGGNKGWVPHHRWLAYNHVNGQPQSCAYCGHGPMPWTGGTHHAINIDHINEIKGDDRLDNLTFACSWCNMFKSAWPLAYHEHMHAIDTYGHLPPQQRPTPMNVLIDQWMIPSNDILHNLQLNRESR